MVDHVKVRVQLAAAGMRQWQLAKRLQVPPSTLSDWLRGAKPQPEDLAERIALVLGTSATAVEVEAAT